jgi:hypothetical protein
MSDFSQPPPVNPYDSPEMARPGMSGAAKVLIGLGIGCGVLVLLCCGGFIFTGFYFTRSIQQAMSEDPATIRRVAESIVAIEVPEELTPEISIDYTMPIVDRKVMSLAVFTSEHKRSALVLFQLAADFGDFNEQFRQSMRESGRDQWKEVRLEEPERFETQINGEPAEFNVGKGKREKSSEEVWQAMGSFEGKGGAAMLFLQLDAEEFTKDDAMAILKSMK